MSRTALRTLGRGLAAALGLCLAWPVLAQPAGMPDPRRMSGISRVDSGLEAGAISVRALLGSFAQPAVDTEITLELFSRDRRSLGTQTLRSDAAGRVTFRQLSQRYPELVYAVAKAKLGDAVEQTQPIMLDPRAGSRVLLVKGATAMQKGAPGGAGMGAGMPPGHGSGGHHGAGAEAPAGGLKAPALCRPNELDTHPPGTLVVGVIEFSAKGQLNGRAEQTVTLQVTAPGKAARTLTAKTDLNGRATFTGLSGEDYPEGTQFQVFANADPSSVIPPSASASARADGTVPPRKIQLRVFKPDASKLVSERFAWGKEAKVVLLTRNCVKPEQLPVQEVKVTLIRHSMTGDKTRMSHRLGQDGQVLIPIENHHDGDFYSLVAQYQGAPFQSGFFQPPKHAGISAEIPVYEVSSDPTELRSAVQFEFYSREDNMAQVNRFYQVMMPGNRAFWLPGFRIEGGEDTRWFKVVPSAEAHLQHDEGAPFATLVAPILPGKAVDLSVAFGVPHTGELKIDWTAPFPLERGLGVTSGEMSFVSGAQPPSKKGEHQGAKQAALSALDIHAPGARLCQASGAKCQGSPGKSTVKLVVRGFAYHQPWLIWAGGGVAALSLLGMGLGVGLGRREDPRQALLAQRDELWTRLDQAKAQEDQAQVKQLTAQLNAVYHRLEALKGNNTPKA